jgi:hypothetical protein
MEYAMGETLTMAKGRWSIGYGGTTNDTLKISSDGWITAVHRKRNTKQNNNTHD